MDRRTVIFAGLAACASGLPANAQRCVVIQPAWEYVADTVMGGVSTGGIAAIGDSGRDAMRLTGTVSLENNGGFIQMATALPSGASGFDASGFGGLSFEVKGNGEEYAINLRTTDLNRPWQSYRANFRAGQNWARIDVPFAAFEPSNTDVPLNPGRLRRIGIIAVGRAMDVDVAVANLCFTG